MYSKLPRPRSIRLLGIAPGKASDRVEVSLMVVELDEAPDFEALSYAWGLSSDPVDILCDSQVVSVTQNLHGALLRLRRSDQIRKVWIDALCINQNDLVERSHQVSFMKDIYSRAKHVVVWLGPDEAGQAALATSIINSTVESMKEDSIIADGKAFWTEDDENYQLKLRERLPPTDHADWQAVWWLFRREWFSRVWIIQEVSQDLDSIVNFGDHSFSYYCLVMTVVVFGLRRYPATLDDWQTLIRVLSVYGKVMLSRRMSDHQPPLLEILTFFSSFKATDPRDKLYAVIGLSKEGQNLGKYSLIKSDYRKTVVQTYIDLVRQLISAPRGQDYGEGGLDVLGSTGITRYLEFKSSRATDEQEVFPSWVPQFHQSAPWSFSISTQKQAVNWATSYDSAVQSGPLSSSGSLVLRGVRLGTVAKVYNNPEYYAGRSLGLHGLFEEVKNDLTNYQGHGCVAEAFARVITLGKSDATSETDVVRLLESYRRYKSDPNRDPLSDRIISNWYYQMFLTDGGYIGIGAPPLLGSELWLLFGGRTLYTLHRIEDCYTYMGECFVHGFMNGEGMELWKAGKLQSEWVDLR
jgi:hypothetical protein